MIRSLFKTFLSILLLSTASHAANNYMDMTGRLEIYAPLEASVRSNMVLPSVFVDHQGPITSEEITSIPSGHNGSNALICIDGEPTKTYSLVFPTDDKGILKNDNPSSTLELAVTLSIGTGFGDKTGRILGPGGNDCTAIKGTVTLPSNVEQGHYKGKITITAEYD